MALPAIPPWIKKADASLHNRINTRDVWSFKEVAVIAAKSEIRGKRLAAMLKSDNVIYVKRNRHAH